MNFTVKNYAELFANVNSAEFFAQYNSLEYNV